MRLSQIWYYQNKYDKNFPFRFLLQATITHAVKKCLLFSLLFSLPQMGFDWRFSLQCTSMHSTYTYMNFPDGPCPGGDLCSTSAIILLIPLLISLLECQSSKPCSRHTILFDNKWFWIFTHYAHSIRKDHLSLGWYSQKVFLKILGLNLTLLYRRFKPSRPFVNMGPQVLLS